MKPQNHLRSSPGAGNAEAGEPAEVRMFDWVKVGLDLDRENVGVYLDSGRVKDKIKLPPKFAWWRRVYRSILRCLTTWPSDSNDFKLCPTKRLRDLPG